ncbi:MFS transporter [Wenzhouxiangella limi]|uniref:MFS transporter n=1 Tax=Wenzhouxiangella limi TaxID=2707351 RepID=A0A845VAG4_9GAMM|nr:MFS transporter [Wenzhouxiangella limi]NDY96895.1 MFS transporter [Wenzhouxiangella limi]
MSESRLARFAAIVLLYFMQGIPVGLSIIAIPAWLAADGASPVAVGAFVGTALLPWSLKLFNGLLMDRFTFKPMGRRRSWILGGQDMMLVVLLALAASAPGSADIFALTAFFFALNLCAVFNDVAVDGMTMDIVPHEERTTINGCMFAAQTLGLSASAFIAGQLLASGQITLMALLLAGFVAVASGFVSLFRERPGERLMPWNKGQPSAECQARQQDAWWPILKGLFKALMVPTTIIFLLGIGLSQATFTFTDAVAPTLAVQQLGWTSEQYSSFASAMSLLAAVIGAAATPFLVKFFGLRNTMFGLFIGLGLTALAGGLTLNDWQDARIFSILFGIQYVLSTLLLAVMAYTFAVIPLGIAYAAGFVLLWQKAAPVLRVLTAPGRMALTNYLSQTVIGLTVFYGIGLNQAGLWSIQSLVVFSGVIYASQIVFSLLWLKSFRYGPMEWLWRSLTYGKAPQMKRIALP